MMLIEGFKKDTNNSLKEIQKNMGQQVEALKEDAKKTLRNYRTKQTSEGIKQNHSGSKNGSRNKKEITKGDNSGDRNQQSWIQTSATEYKKQKRESQDNQRKH